MIGRRSELNFEKHELIISEQEGLSVHYLKKPNTLMDSIKYINTNGILAVTGDYGNWIFCREFHPNSKETQVSGGYWCEKLQISSTQDPLEFNSEETRSELKVKLNEYIKYTEEENIFPDTTIVEYLEECINLCDDHESVYINYAYNEMPKTYDCEDVIFVKTYKYWFSVILDGFEEICRRLKENEK